MNKKNCICFFILYSGVALCREKGRGGIPLRHGAETGDSYIYTGWKSCSL